MAVCLDVVRRLRQSGLTIPLLLMGYYNPILAYGVEEFARAAADAGADGFIVVDLPPEEALPVQTACAVDELDLIYLLAPTSSEQRIAVVAAQASGFLYCVSVAGVTGARHDLSPELAEFLARVRRHTSLPLAVGFGISQAEHVQAVADLGADAAVIGSAIIDLIDRTPAGERERKGQRVPGGAQRPAEGLGPGRLRAYLRFLIPTTPPIASSSLCPVTFWSPCARLRGSDGRTPYLQRRKANL